MVAITLKKKYTTGGGYKSQKSQHGNSGKSKRKIGKAQKQNTVGIKLMLVNMSGVDNFCPVTGTKLPRHGMVVDLNGTYYADYKAAARA